MPVARNTERIPSDVLGVVQRLAFEKLTATPAPQEGWPSPIDLALAHLSPRLVTLPPVSATLHRAGALLVPVATTAAAP